MAIDDTSGIPSNKPWWRKKSSFIVFFLTVLVSLIVFTVWYILFRPYVSTDDARIDAVIVRIATSGVGGVVTKLYVKEGDIVKKGQTLIELDHRKAQANLVEVSSKLDLAKKEYERVTELAKHKGIPDREVDKAESNLKALEGQFNLLEVALDETYLKSPFDGVVVHKVVEEGDFLERGQIALSVADILHAWVSANIEETKVGRIQLNQKVEIHVDEGGLYQGHVYEIRHATQAQFALIPSDNPSGNFIKLVQRIPIKISIDSPQSDHFRVGQSVEIRIRTIE